MAKNGLVLITKTSFSGASSVSIDNCFSATYTHYIVTRNCLFSGGVVNVRGRLRVSGADESGATYRYQYVNASSTSVTGARTTGATFFEALLGYGETGAFGFAEAWISNPFEAVRTTAWSDSPNDHSGSIVLQSLVQANDNATSYTGLTIYPSSGTMTGSIGVWGLVKS